MQTDLLNNIHVNDIREVNIIDSDVLDTLLNVLDAKNDEISGGNLYNYLDVVEQNLYHLAKIEDSFSSRTLLALNNIYLYLIEETDWLVRLPKNEADRERSRVENVCRRLRICAEAVAFLMDNTADAFINRFLTKVQKTGYIHRKEKTCQIVLDIMRLDNKYFEYVPVLVDIVLMRQREEWIASDLRDQLVAILQEFIAYKVETLKNVVSPDRKEEQEQVAQVIKAIALQLLLYNDSDSIDFSYNRALLYRFLSYVPKTNALSLLNNAYNCLIGATNNIKLEYSWEDLSSRSGENLSSIGLIASKLSVPKVVTPVNRIYLNEFQIIDITEKRLMLKPRNMDVVKPVKAIPSTIHMWNGLQVEIDTSLSNKINQTTIDLKLYDLWWNEIERHLFRERKMNHINDIKKKKPSIGDRVWIVIDGIYDPSYLTFHATIKDDNFMGDGIISIKGDIVDYAPKNYASYFLDNGFRDSKTNKPFLFDAEVIGHEGDMFHFSMAKLIWEDWKDSDISDYGREVNAVVTYRNEVTGQCIAVTEDGPSILFRENNGIVQQGDQVRLRVTKWKNTEEYGFQLWGEYISSSNDVVTYQLAIVNLLEWYSRGEVYDEHIEENEPEVVEQATNNLEKKDIEEIILLVDRQAYISKDLIDRFLLLNLAGTLSRIIDDLDRVEYYHHCCEQQIALQEFGKNNTFNVEKLRELDRIPEDMVLKFPMLKLRRQEIQVLNALGKIDDMEKILSMLNNTDNTELKKLCNLVLAYNFLSEFKEMDDKKHAIIDNISSLMNIKLDIQEAEFIGSENEMMEFKSSLIYIANAEHKIILDPEAQMHVILKEVNAFLNTKGGKLYIGVNNLGYAVGLFDDIEWFQRNPGKLGNITDMDTYQQYLTNAIYKKWPDINTLVQISSPNYNGRNVVLVDIHPSKDPLKLDGYYYYRVGTETRTVTKEGEKEFIKRRPEQYESLKK